MLKRRASILALLLACGDDAEPAAPVLDASSPARDAATALVDARVAAIADATVEASAPDAARPAVRGPRGPSAGCGKPAPSGDGSAWKEHDLTVGGVAARYRQGGTKYGTQHGFDFEHRNYFLRLPSQYDQTKPYPLVISAGGCGATDGLSGKGGGANPLPNEQSDALQVGLSYVYASGAGACFTDGASDTPDLPYFDAVLAELDAHYCFDRGRVFVSGFSSGAWETYMLACARGGVIRAIGTQAGGLRKERPTCSGMPVAAFLTAGVNDDNPIVDVDKSGFDSGSGAARDVILETNGCSSAASEPYVSADAPADWNCVRYTSCPAAYPVIWCAISADGGKHGAGSPKAFWPFWSALER
jgi:poly(3-hydroxybutyrate) depolymerase